MVDKFYKAAPDGGGRNNGSSGEKPYHSGYYVAFVLELDGDNIEALYHCEARRSAPSVSINF